MKSLWIGLILAIILVSLAPNSANTNSWIVRKTLVLLWGPSKLENEPNKFHESDLPNQDLRDNHEGKVRGRGLCNKKDKVIWNTKTSEVKKALSKCGPSCWGKAECTSKCMMKKEGLSPSCADCFGKFSGCARSNCMWKCWINSL